MINKLGLFIISILLCLQAVAQKEDRNWVFGYNCGINFNDLSNPVPFVSKINSQEVSASISDKNGTLMFYISTDDFSANRTFNILDKNHSIINNGDSIIIHSSASNGAVIIPAVNDSNRYYLFHIGRRSMISNCPFSLCLILHKSIVELINGELIVTLKNNIILNEPIGERLATVKHANGSDSWIFVHQLGINTSCSNKFYRFLLTELGVQFNGEQNIGTLHCHNNSPIGEMTFSKTGNKLATSIHSQNTVDVFFFNRCTGLLFNHNRITGSNVLPNPYGCEFSPNEKFLYVTGYAGLMYGFGDLYQYNLDDFDISASGMIIYSVTDTFLSPAQLQIGPDNKIYLTHERLRLNDQFLQQKYLSVINAPDSLEMACDFTSFGFYLGDSSETTAGLPNMPNYNLGPSGIYAIKSGASDTVVFCFNQIEGVLLGSPAEEHVVYSWSPSFFLSDTTTAQPMASPTKDTWYYMTVRDTVSCNTERIDSVYVVVADTCVVGVEESESYKPLAVSVYPNPASEVLHIACEMAGGCKGYTFILYDILGKKLIEEILSGKQASLQISSLQAGVYFYQIHSHETSAAGKIIVR